MGEGLKYNRSCRIRNSHTALNEHNRFKVFPHPLPSGHVKLLHENFLPQQIVGGGGGNSSPVMDKSYYPISDKIYLRKFKFKLNLEHLPMKTKN